MRRATAPPRILGLIADPVRWQLVGELARSDRRVGELVDLVDKPQNLVSYHLREMRDEGLVRARHSSADGRDVYYAVDLVRFRELLASAAVALHPALQLAPAAAPATAPASRRRRARVRVLFLCTGNSARSQMAEALLEHRSAHSVSASSAGSHPKPLHPAAVRVMAGRGIDISANTAKPLTRFTRTRFDRVVTLCDKVREVCPEFAGLPPHAHWSIADPAAHVGGNPAGDAAFEAVADELEVRIAFLLAELSDHPSHEETR
jgi:protein-tyrosine-phosphatase